MKRLILLSIVIFYLHLYVNAQNISQWRGTDRNGIYNEDGLLDNWPEEGPELLWFSDTIGYGFSSIAVTGDFVFATGILDTLEIITAFDLNGKFKWQIPYGNVWKGPYYPARSTPTVIDSLVYMISGNGEIACLRAISGEKLWSLDAYSKFEGHATMWGVCESPLILDDKLFYTCGGNRTTMVALNKHTGETIWESKSLDDSTAYVSPILIELDDKKIIANVSANYFFGVNADNGDILWKYKYSDLKWNQTHWYSPIINCNSPLYHDSKVFISKGYDHKAAMFEINENGNNIELLWIDTILDVHIGGMVLVDGYIYGANWIDNRNGNWCCIDWETGKIMYEKEWEFKGSIIYADSLLYCYEEKGGHIAIVEPDTNDFNIISSFKIDKGKGPHWAHPVIKNGTLYIRHGNVLMAYNLKN